MSFSNRDIELFLRLKVIILDIDTCCNADLVEVFMKPLFGDLAAAFRGEKLKAQPSLGEVARAFKRHAELLTEFFEEEDRACRDIRKHVAWYFKGYSVGGELRASLATVKDLAQLDELLAQLDWEQPYPGADAEGQRGRAGTPKSPSLPQGWLDSRELQETHRAELTEAELSTSGG